MPLIKVHISSLELPAKKPLLVKRIREVLVEKLNIDERLGQVVLYEAVPQHRAIHPDRGNDFVFLEVLMYPGRPAEMKKELMKALIGAVNSVLGIDSKDISCCVQEITQENWSGGIGHSLSE